MRTAEWLRMAVEDAAERGLPELKPLLEALALATARLREADVRLRGEPEGDGGR